MKAPVISGSPRSVPKRGLSREIVAQTAYDMLDRDGFEKFSLRGLAAELGVHVTSLRGYYESRTELLQAVAQMIIRELEHEQDERAPWQQHLRTSMKSFKQMLLRHSYLPMLYEYSIEGMLAHTELELSALARAGFTPPEAARAFDTVLTFVLGAALREYQGRNESAMQIENQSTEVQSAFPHLKDAGQYLHEMDDVFEFGLNGLLQVIAEEHARSCPD